MIALLDGVGDALQFCGRMIELPRDFDFQLRMSRDRIIINRQATIRRDKFAFPGQDQRIDFQRARFHAARGGKELSNRIAELRRLLGRESARFGGFSYFRFDRSALHVAGDLPG